MHRKIQIKQRGTYFVAHNLDHQTKQTSYNLERNLKKENLNILSDLTTAVEKIEYFLSLFFLSVGSLVVVSMGKICTLNPGRVLHYKISQLRIYTYFVELI